MKKLKDWPYVSSNPIEFKKMWKCIKRAFSHFEGEPQYIGNDGKNVFIMIRGTVRQFPIREIK